MTNLTLSGIAQLFSEKPLSQPFMRRGPFSICRYQKEEFQQKEPYSEHVITVFNDRPDLGRIIYEFNYEKNNFSISPITLANETFFYDDFFDDKAKKQLGGEAEMLDTLVLFSSRIFPEYMLYQFENLSIKLPPKFIQTDDIYTQITIDTGMFMRNYFSYRVSKLQKEEQKNHGGEKK